MAIETQNSSIFLENISTNLDIWKKLLKQYKLKWDLKKQWTELNFIKFISDECFKNIDNLFLEYNYDNFLEFYNSIDSEEFNKCKKSIFFWIIICARYYKACLHEDCIMAVFDATNSSENTIGLQIWLYFFGSVLVYNEYKDILKDYIENKYYIFLKLACFSKQLPYLTEIENNLDHSWIYDKNNKYGNKDIYLIALLAELPYDILSQLFLITIASNSSIDQSRLNYTLQQPEDKIYSLIYNNIIKYNIITLEHRQFLLKC